MTIAKLNERIRHLEELNTRQAEKIGALTIKLKKSEKSVEHHKARSAALSARLANLAVRVANKIKSGAQPLPDRAVEASELMDEHHPRNRPVFKSRRARH